jgi:hypothetical protein
VVERLPESVRTPAVARAVVSPSAFLLAGGGTALAILGGLPLAGAVAIGAACWAGRVAVAAMRRTGPRREHIDPFAVGEPWRRFVQDALAAQRHFADTVRHTAPGPLRDRLADLGGRIDDGTHECWRIACQGASLQRGIQSLDIAQVKKDLDAVDADLDGADRTSKASLERTKQALEAQQASYERLAAVWQDARDKLRTLNAQLDEAVARAVELSLSSTDASALNPLAGDVDSLVNDLEALRQGLEEAGSAATA